MVHNEVLSEGGNGYRVGTNQFVINANKFEK